MRSALCTLLTCCTVAAAAGANPSRAAAQAACKPITHEGAGFTVCAVDLRSQTTRLFWRRPDGQDFSYLSKLPDIDPATGRRLQFAMNAGMYHPDYRPVGLYIEGRRELAKASTARGPGNFHMKPNGIFYIAGNNAGVMEAGVLETGAYLKQKVQADMATQSGPMLVIDGKLHPRFTPQGESRKGRNGVGVRDASTLFFAISEEDVSFGTFARLFRDVLKCPNALFLDGGSVPTLYIPGGVRGGNFLPLGPMVGVYGK